MTDNGPNLATFKIRVRDKEWAEDEQKKLKRAEHRIVTQAELFTRMKQRWLAHQSQPSTFSSKTQENTGTPKPENVVSSTLPGMEIPETHQAWVKKNY